MKVLLLAQDFSRLVAMIKPKVGIKLYQLSHARIFSVLSYQNIIPCFLSSCSSERSIPSYSLFKIYFVCFLYHKYVRSLHNHIIAFQAPKNITGAYLIMYVPINKCVITWQAVL